MDFNNRVGSKFGLSGVNQDESNRNLKERLRSLAENKIDIDKDPYIIRNHLGGYECKLCLTVHINEGSYLVHTQGKKHKSALQARVLYEEKEAGRTGKTGVALGPDHGGVGGGMIRKYVKIGKPGYKILIQKNTYSNKPAILFQVFFPENNAKITPRHRFMSCYEQKVESSADKNYLYVIFACEPYQHIGIKIPNWPIDSHSEHTFNHYDPNSKTYYLQVTYK